MTAPITPDINPEPTTPLPPMPEQVPGVGGGVPVYDPPANPDMPTQPQPEPSQNPDTPGIADLPGGGMPAFI